MLTFIFLILPLVQTRQLQPRVHFQWNYVNYTWPSIDDYRNAIKSDSYIAEHNVISGIKVWKNRVFVTVPRLKKGVPSTLNSVAIDDKIDPLLEPYPNWEMQNERDCSALQFVQSMEIDPLGRMWIINNGRTEIRTDEPKSICSSRLLILDLNDDGKILLDYKFPDGVINPESVYLNDIVLDHEDGGYAYITDNDSKHPGIIVFSLRKLDSWKVTHRSMMIDNEALEMTVNGTTFINKSPVNGIALSHASASNRLVYYFPITSFQMYAMPSWALKNQIENIDRYVIDVGRKPSQSGGMIISSSGMLFFGLLTEDAVSSWNVNNPPFTENQRIVIMDHARSQYPDSFAIDEFGRLWYSSNRLQAYRNDNVDVTKPNIRLIVTPIFSRSYQYFEDDSPPILPLIN